MHRWMAVVFLLLLFIAATSKLLLIFSDGEVSGGHFHSKRSPGNDLTSFLFRQTTRLNKSFPYWIVYNAEGYTGDLHFLGTANWNVIVVGANETVNKQSCTSCLFFDDDSLHDMSQVVLPISNDGRKAIINSSSAKFKYKLLAYLATIVSGADWVLIADRPFLPPENLRKKVTEGRFVSGLLYNEKDVFEPCTHFMDQYTWTGKMGGHTRKQFVVNTVSQRSVFVHTSHCYKTKDMTTTQHTNAFDPQSPVPFIKAGKFSILDTSNMLMPKEAMWTLAVSLITSENDDLYIRALASLVTQRLLWETNSDIGFLPFRQAENIVLQFNNDCPTCELELETNSKLTKVLFLLEHWICPLEENIVDCTLNLMMVLSDVAKTPGLVDLFQFYFEALEQINYGFAPREGFTFEKKVASETGIRVFYAPRKVLSHKTQTPSILFQNMKEGGINNPQDILIPACAKVNVTLSEFIPEDYKVKNILLVVVFNWASYISDIPTVERLYGRHFQHIVYCSEAIPPFSQFYNDTNNAVTYVESFHFHGHRGYECMTTVLQMNYDVDGYLQMGDDVLLNVWNIKNLPLKKPWFPKFHVGDVRSEKVPDIDKRPSWIPWDFDVGKKTAEFTLKNLKSMTSHPVLGTHVTSFLSKLLDSTVCESCVMYGASDIFYIPQNMSLEFLFYARWFLKHRLFLEIAVPTILSGLTTRDTLHLLRGKYVWYGDREKYEELYDPEDVFHHSWKMSRIQSENGAKFLCSRFLKRIDDDVKDVN